MSIAITMGDANGVGPEILLKAYADGAILDCFAVGDMAALLRASEALNIRVPLHIMRDVGDISPGELNLYNLAALTSRDIEPGTISAKTGEASRRSIETAANLVLEGLADAMVTLPVSKEAVQLTTPGFTGHTEMIAEMCGQQRYTMMLSSEVLTVTHVSTHVSMAEAIAAATRARILDVIRMTRTALLGPLGREPRIAVAGLNAHAGENGLFGREEIEQIQPAVQDAQSENITCTGPYPPDTVFWRASKGEFDAVVCMYHDQGHIPLKLLDFSGGVNVTLGLKIIRTSVDHGTAFDIAYQGKADTGSFVRAFHMAAAMMRG